MLYPKNVGLLKNYDTTVNRCIIKERSKTKREERKDDKKYGIEGER